LEVLRKYGANANTKKYRKKGWKEQDAEASYSPRFSEFLRR
jgi:hypothetical protein